MGWKTQIAFVLQKEAALSKGCKGADLAEDKPGPLSLSQAPAVKRSVSARQTMGASSVAKIR